MYSSHIHDSVAVGGNLELFASVEDTFPITAGDMLRGVVFYDIDMVKPVRGIWNTEVPCDEGLWLAYPRAGHRPGAHRL